jgi:calcineurin-like phosphoesterase family protein
VQCLLIESTLSTHYFFISITSMSIFLTADLHLGHANIAGPKTSTWKTGYRNFRSVEEMDHAIILGINAHVKEDDTLYVVGDFAMGGHHNIPDYRRRIMCKNIHIIRGNHDEHINKYVDYFSSISDSKLIYVRKEGIYMNHYASRVWYGSHKGYYHAYGHSHGTLEHTPYGRSMDVGVDNIYRLCGAYRPITTDELFWLLKDRKIELPDHHSPETNAR